MGRFILSILAFAACLPAHATLFKYGKVKDFYFPQHHDRLKNIPEFEKPAIYAGGTLDEGATKDLQAQFKAHPKTRILVVTNLGGNSEEALKMAEFIEQKKLTLWVRLTCVSACAAYIFPAAERTIADGIIGFHGNATSFLTVGWNVAINDPGLTKAQRQALIQLKREARKKGGLLERDAEFLKRRGLRQQLFDAIQTRPLNEDDNAYVMLSAEALEFEGFKNVKHVQPPDRAHTAWNISQPMFPIKYWDLNHVKDLRNKEAP